MTLALNYPDTARFYSTTPSSYGNDKVVDESSDVPIIALQGTAFSRNNSQDAIDADMSIYPDFNNAFIAANHNRLEGMYVLVQLYGASFADSWFKVVSVVVNRDHLLDNQIDNIQVLLKKTRPLAGVS